MILISSDDLMLLFTANIFLIALLTPIVLLIEKISKKIVAPHLNWKATIFLIILKIYLYYSLYYYFNFICSIGNGFPCSSNSDFL